MHGDQQLEQHLMRELIMDHQTSSEVIGGHQRSSGLLEVHLEPAASHELLGVWGRGEQRADEHQ